MWGKVDVSNGGLTSPSQVDNEFSKFHRVGGWGSSQNDVGKVEVSSGKLTSPSQVDNDHLKFHRVGGCTGWYRVLNALTDVDHQTTTPVLSCAADISVQTHRVKAMDLWVRILLAVPPLSSWNFFIQGITIPLYDTELVEGRAWGYMELCVGELVVTADCAW